MEKDAIVNQRRLPVALSATHLAKVEVIRQVVLMA